MRTRCEKNDIVNSLSGQFTEANCFYIVNMFKINVANMMKLRRDCRKDNASLKIDGTDVSQASLSNIGIIRKLGLTMGAKILVNKSNQIIFK